MNDDTRTKLEARRKELMDAINSAPQWGAAVGAMYEELQGINKNLALMPKPEPKPEPAPKPVFKPARRPASSDA